MQNVGTVDFGGILIRAIDVIGTNALVGCRNGNIYQVDLNTQSKQVIMESHSDGEVWGLAIVDQDTVVTTGDDNQIKAWSVSKR
jgi:WD40 repeat protein